MEFSARVILSMPDKRIEKAWEIYVQLVARGADPTVAAKKAFELAEYFERYCLERKSGAAAKGKTSVESTEAHEESPFEVLKNKSKDNAPTIHRQAPQKPKTPQWRGLAAELARAPKNSTGICSAM